MKEITTWGIHCGVCGRNIMPLDDYESFATTGIKPVMHCHAKCKPLVVAARDDWHKLPPGPLREVFELARMERIKARMERVRSLLAVAIIAVGIGLVWGGFASIFTTRRASMVVGGVFTASTFVIIMLAQWAYDGRDGEEPT